jgi:hypothetical protein
MENEQTFFIGVDSSSSELSSELSSSSSSSLLLSFFETLVAGFAAAEGAESFRDKKQKIGEKKS